MQEIKIQRIINFDEDAVSTMAEEFVAKFGYLPRAILVGKHTYQRYIERTRPTNPFMEVIGGVTLPKAHVVTGLQTTVATLDILVDPDVTEGITLLHPNDKHIKGEPPALPEHKEHKPPIMTSLKLKKYYPEEKVYECIIKALYMPNIGGEITLTHTMYIKRAALLGIAGQLSDIEQEGLEHISQHGETLS